MGEVGVESALALPLVVGDEPIGCSPSTRARPRPLSANESALLVALAAQLAVLVQNARLHERAQELSSEREEALASEREAAKRLHALYEISRSFAQSLSLDTTLDVLAESIVTLLGVDAAVIRMPDERGVELVARAVARERRARRRGRARAARRGRSSCRGGELARAARAQRAARRSTPTGRRRSAARSALLAPFLRKGSSAAVVPIATPAELLATLTIVSLHPGRPVAGEIAETALSIAGQAALAIDNARLYGQQKAFADTMQRSLLPRAAPELPGLELGDVYESAARVEVGGDVYDYLTLGDGRLAVVLGDVTGHGVDATADMAMAKYVFRSLAREHVDPGEFLAAANEVVSSEIAPGPVHHDGRARDRRREGRGRVRERAAIRRRGWCSRTAPSRAILARGLALGIDAPQAYETVTAELRAGRDRRRLHGRRGRGAARRRAVRGRAAGRAPVGARSLPPREIAEAALAACRDWTEGELTDDFAVVVIKRPAEQ